MSKENQLSIIIQKGSNPPSHYWVSPTLVKRTLLLMSFLFVITSTVSIGLSLFYAGDYFTFLSSKKNLETKLATLELQMQEDKQNWEKKRTELENFALIKTVDNNKSMQLIQTLPNSLDNEKEMLVEVDNLKITIDKSKLNINFHLSNQSDQNRISGRMFTLLRTKNSIHIYPTPKSPQITKFNEGEFFSISRFRESKLTFNDLNFPKEHLESGIITIVIYSLQSDLLLKKSFQLKDYL